MLIDEAAYRECFEDYKITDCVVRSSLMLYFVLVADDPHFLPADLDMEEDTSLSDAERPTRIVSCYLDEPADKRWGYATYKGYQGLYAGASREPLGQFVGVDMDGKVLSIGSGFKGFENPIPGSRHGPLRGVVTKVKTIGGLTHISTGYRGLACRENMNQWRSLCSNLEFQPDPDETSALYGFEDFDAFDTGEFYCIGGKGDVWRFDGNRWQQLGFPNKDYLEAVCCGGDGYVYLSDASGGVWKGRMDRWVQIHESTWMPARFKDMVWFQDRVYSTSEEGILHEIIDDVVHVCDLPLEISNCAENLSVGDGVMLMAGLGGAAYHDGKEWRSLVNRSAF
ncbi:hypothetical protein [Microvirga guangxiensis]|uniref:Uncharacterized protein n=1 Tax=Microvirga guangxiensis TaxID=549386 RepID=A0A1G5JPX9_9HYPH|nr:hypothetical protein [Microvirga guangxiensis]SCY90387.1 hypothetical protein SAMN02927923_02808 [Microvirga guangxiensis]